MQNTFLSLQIFLSVIITVFVLLQSQGSGLGATWGGGGETYHTRRGVEKVIFTLTIVAIILFALVSIAVIA
ncbi:MAG: preprotein translocase subunit SecG [Candidatus Pacebacteria bacterium RIFOXYB1_FULL_39_46]|nr:MAG: preprotein translocase subunit SecG [Candidatus Pacebacteria bacterium RIFOXYB1_FULL_39_46]OGJ39066.1 MAG: preprotein translocase subunit SecG [Candidatus Pacebacteria bacterium RIFOXYA1_FULL_38_18]OGJ39589.1 MAG: preprotein translocase subunit SecG [Candidatus Pacebacteria bacterium RIFOXYD1_FULL_39_27]OGJ40701.1 MAG: preprotein translocase subunit SecG [Candidatus Pacebacteria bacterium RIFOXYC1_FULL_39_21]